MEPPLWQVQGENATYALYWVYSRCLSHAAPASSQVSASGLSHSERAQVGPGIQVSCRGFGGGDEALLTGVGILTHWGLG